jgi:hypothetical protein
MATSNDTPASGEYGGVEFYVDKSWRFHVPALERDYDSHALMCAAIDRWHDQQKKLARRRPMAIAVVSDTGKQAVIAGIHAGHGHFVTKPSVEHGRLYVDVPWIRAAVDEMRRLENRQDHIRAALHRFEVDETSSWRFNVDQLAERATDVEKAAAKAVKVAEKTNLDAELLKTEPPRR